MPLSPLAIGMALMPVGEALSSCSNDGRVRNYQAENVRNFAKGPLAMYDQRIAFIYAAEISRASWQLNFL